MEAKTLYHYGDDDLDVRMARMRDTLNKLTALIEHQQTRPPQLETRVIYRPVFLPAVPLGKKRTPTLDFPFNLLDRAVERFVKVVVARWIARITHLLHRKRR